MANTLKKGFTLLELLVVIGIIAVLGGVLISGMFGATESANATKCLVNMRSLWTAVDSVASANGYYPPASSYESVNITENGTAYGEVKGWIGWLSGDAYKDSPTATKAQRGWYVSLSSDDDDTYVAVTNGAIWKASNGNISSYVCPTHVKECKEKGFNPGWSYVMSSYFTYDPDRGGGNSYMTADDRVRYGSIKDPRRVLMFAEVPFIDEPGCGQKAKLKGANGDAAYDCTLEYDDGIWGGAKEAIGFNHKVDERTVTGHVIFADGHTEQLVAPNGSTDLEKFTKWLCEGTQYSFKNGEYRENE